MASTSKGAPPPAPASNYSLTSIFWTKKSYNSVAADFHPYHKHDLNVLLHVFTTGLGMWGAFQMAVALDAAIAVYIYAGLVFLTTPLLTGTIHTAFVAACLMIPVEPLSTLLVPYVAAAADPLKVCAIAIIAGYGLQDLSHYLCNEETMLSGYITSNPAMLIVHTFWLMPLVIDAVVMRSCYLPHLVNRNRNFFVQVANKEAADTVRKFIHEKIPPKPETTHLWPHQEPAIDKAVTEIENDAGVLAGFRQVFSSKHFDVRPVVPMNEIYVTAVGAIKEITSDAVFYTPHNDGPYWFLPFASLYRVLVGVTENQMVRTRFNLQHDTKDAVVDLYDTLGFDYNRELHWIDHVPGTTNKERRSLIKLHYIVYPKGWHRYGAFCARLNTTYNTWARGNFLRTLRPKGLYENVLAWWIWLTTWFNATFELFFGWPNLVYILGSYALGPLPFLLLTSYRHYMVYISTFAFRNPPVAHGFLMRDAKLFKVCALLHLAQRLVPLIELPRDIPGMAIATCGFSTTILATMRLGMVRTYFGSELGFVEPKWISAFPYGVIPHPMIVGQLFAYASILVWWREVMPFETTALIAGHMAFYTIHMVQEMFTSSY